MVSRLIVKKLNYNSKKEESWRENILPAEDEE